MGPHHSFTHSRYLSTGSCIVVFLLLTACVSTTVDEAEAPVSGTTIYELFALQPDLGAAFNVVFYADESYGDLTNLEEREAFVEEVAALVENSFWENEVYYQNLARINYFYSTDTGSITEGDPCPDVEYPASRFSDGAFADLSMLIHTENLRDCASPGSGWASSTADNYTVAPHEAAHVFFGLVDEYCCNAPYFEIPPVMYATEDDCEDDVDNLAWRECVERVSTYDSSVGWRSEGDIHNAIMIGSGIEIWEFGPADWVLIEAAFQLKSGGIPPIAPTVVAPDDWQRNPAP